MRILLRRTTGTCHDNVIRGGTPLIDFDINKHGRIFILPAFSVGKHFYVFTLQITFLIFSMQIGWYRKTINTEVDLDDILDDDYDDDFSHSYDTPDFMPEQEGDTNDDLPF